MSSIFLACLISNEAPAATSCNDFKLLSRVSASVYICDDADRKEVRDAYLHACKAFDGDDLFNPLCLEQWRETLHQHAKSAFNAAWAQVPEKDRGALWGACRDESSRFDLLFKCIKKSSASISVVAKSHFKDVERYLRQIEINAAMDAKARTEICFGSGATSKAKGEVRDAINRIKNQIARSCSKSNSDDLVKSMSEDLANRLKNELDWVGCENKPKEDSSACNFRSIKFSPDSNPNVAGQYEKARYADQVRNAIRECEIKFKPKLLSQMQCSEEFGFYFGAVDKLIHSFVPGEKDITEAFIEDLKKTYAQNALASHSLFFNAPLSVPDSCTRFNSAFQSINVRRTGNFEEELNKDPKRLSETVKEAVTALFGLEKHIHGLIQKKSSLKAAANRRREDKGIVDTESLDTEISSYSQKVGEILRTYPFLVGPNPPNALIAAINESPSALIPVARLAKSKSLATDLEAILKDYEGLLRSELDKVCALHPSKLKWEDLVENKALVESALSSKNSKLKEELNKFKNCILDKKDRYATMQGAIITATLPLPFLAPAIGVIGYGGIAAGLNLFAAGSALGLSFDDFLKSREKYDNAVRCSFASNSQNCTAEQIAEAQKQVHSSALAVALAAGFSIHAGKDAAKAIVSGFKNLTPKGQQILLSLEESEGAPANIDPEVVSSAFNALGELSEVNVAPNKAVGMLLDIVRGKKISNRNLANQLSQKGVDGRTLSLATSGINWEAVGALKYLRELAVGELPMLRLNSSEIIPELFKIIESQKTPSANKVFLNKEFAAIFLANDHSGTVAIPRLVSMLEKKSFLGKVDLQILEIRKNASDILMQMIQIAGKNPSNSLHEGRLIEAVETLAKTAKGSGSQTTIAELLSQFEYILKDTKNEAVKIKLSEVIAYLKNDTPLASESLSHAQKIDQVVEKMGNLAVPINIVEDPRYASVRKQAIDEFKKFMKEKLASLDDSAQKKIVAALEKTAVNDGAVPANGVASYSLKAKAIRLREKDMGKTQVLIHLAHESDHLILDLVSEGNSPKLAKFLREYQPQSFIGKFERSAIGAEHSLIQRLWNIESDGVKISNVLLRDLQVPEEYHELLKEMFGSVKMKNGIPDIVPTARATEILNQHPELADGLEANLVKSLENDYLRLTHARTADQDTYVSHWISSSVYQKQIRSERNRKAALYIEKIIWGGLLAYGWHTADKYLFSDPKSKSKNIPAQTK